jgi:hypothetical protein
MDICEQHKKKLLLHRRYCCLHVWQALPRNESTLLLVAYLLRACLPSPPQAMGLHVPVHSDMNSSTCSSCSTDTNVPLWLILRPFLMALTSLSITWLWKTLNVLYNCISQYGCNQNQSHTLEILLTMTELPNVLSPLLLPSVYLDRQSHGPRFGARVPGIFLWGKGRSARRADKLTAICESTV